MKASNLKQTKKNKKKRNLEKTDIMHKKEVIPTTYKAFNVNFVTIEVS